MLQNMMAVGLVSIAKHVVCSVESTRPVGQVAVAKHDTWGAGERADKYDGCGAGECI